MSDALIVCFMVNIIAEKIFRVGSCILIPVQGVGEKWEKFRNFFFFKLWEQYLYYFINIVEIL